MFDFDMHTSWLTVLGCMCLVSFPSPDFCYTFLMKNDGGVEVFAILVNSTLANLERLNQNVSWLSLG